MTNREVMQQALDAQLFLKQWGECSKAVDMRAESITALRAALAAPDVEPVAWQSKEQYNPNVGSWYEYYDEFRTTNNRHRLTPLYARPHDDTALLRQCLDAFEAIPENIEGYLPDSCDDAVAALRERLDEK